jgi:hypothetical protein
MYVGRLLLPEKDFIKNKSKWLQLHSILFIYIYTYTYIYLVDEQSGRRMRHILDLHFTTNDNTNVMLPMLLTCSIVTHET